MDFKFELWIPDGLLSWLVFDSSLLRIAIDLHYYIRVHIAKSLCISGQFSLYHRQSKLSNVVLNEKKFNFDYSHLLERSNYFFIFTLD